MGDALPEPRTVTDLRAVFIMGRAEIDPRLVRTLTLLKMSTDEIFEFLMEIDP